MPQAELTTAAPAGRIILPAFAPGSKLPDLRGLKRWQLFRILQASVHNRVMIAVILVELAERAESDPLLQEELHMIFPPPPLDNLEYVRPHEYRGSYTKGYWRRVRYTLEMPTIPMAEHRLAVSKFSYSLFGTKGIVERPDGTQINRVVHSLGEKFRGIRYSTDEEMAERKRQKAVERMAGQEPPQAQKQIQPRV